MREFNENTITAAVIDRFKDTPDPRLKQIMESLVQHLHDFVRDVEPTFDEWLYGINFLTRIGQMCDDKRQEFILLSDTLGVSMLVDAINHRMPAGATETTVLGPFYVENPPVFPQGADISGEAGGDPLFVDMSVRSVKGTPLGDAVVDVWQSDSEGYYDVQRSELDGGAQLRARLHTDKEGRLRFWSRLPTAYPIPHDGPVGQMIGATKRHPYRPAHLHFMISAPEHRTLVTHLFVKDGIYLDSDAVFAVKESLICEFPVQPAGAVAPDGRKLDREWRKLEYTFKLAD